MCSVRYSCTNCGHQFLKEFPQGQEAEGVVFCPNCGCLKAGKVWPTTHTTTYPTIRRSYRFNHDWEHYSEFPLNFWKYYE